MIHHIMHLFRLTQSNKQTFLLISQLGQERFRSITKSYYRNSIGVLLVYDITNHASFEHIPLWMMEAKRHIEPHRPVFALIGCKADLVANGVRREVTTEEARAFAEQHQLHFIETSSRTGVNVREAFTAVTQEIYNRIQSGEYKIEDGYDGIKQGKAKVIHHRNLKNY